MKKEFLEKPYNLDVFKREFLTKQFDSFQKNEKKLENLPKFHYLKNIRKIWEIRFDDVLDPVLVVEVEHNSKYDPRVSLTKELFKFVSNYEFDGEIYENVLAVFVNPEDKNWRLSLLTTNYDRGKKTFSNPKRFSFLLGPDEKVKTPSERLFSSKFTSFTQLKEAFSVEPVRKEFFKNYLELFVKLYIKVEKSAFKNILIRDGVDLVSFTKNLLWKIVFLYFIQKKGWLWVEDNKSWWDGDKKFLRTLWGKFITWWENNWEKSGFFYNDVLEHLFFDGLNKDRREEDDYDTYFHTKIPYLNWWLFKPEYKGWDKPENIADIDNNIFSNESESGILDIFDQYNFTIDEDDPYDQEVAIDPEMLGRIFETMISVDRKNIDDIVKLYNEKKKLDIWKELNKKFWAFYTPRQIVHYMTKESLILYLSRRLKQTLWNIVKDLDVEDVLRQLWKEKERLMLWEELKWGIYNLLLKPLWYELVKLKIIDPAVGSGAFPMWILQEMSSLLFYISKLLGKNCSLYEIKKKVIQKNIFWVDIEPWAIDIARLRFWLSLVVDASYPEPLPNFEFKFVSANSLIPLPERWLFTKDEIIEKLKQIRFEYFSTSSKKKKEQLQKEFYELRYELFGLKDLMEYDKTSYKAQKKAQELAYKVNVDQTNRLISSWNPFDSKSVAWFFDPQWMFGVDKFDIVIGNPPYLSLEKVEKNLKQEYKKLYKTFASRGDLYVLFMELWYNLLLDNGILSYITSNKYTRANYWKEIRKFLLEKTKILEYIDFNGVKVFENATVDTSILTFEKEIPETNHKLWYCDVNEKFKKDEDLEKYIRENGFWYLQSNLSVESFSFLSDIELKIKEKIEKAGKKLKDWDIEIKFWIKTWLNEAFIIDEETRNKLIQEDPKSAEIIKPILRWKDIDRYKINFANLYLLNVHNNPPVDINQYPAIKKHLDKFYDKLAKRYDKGDTPYNLRNCAYLNEMEREKIIYSEIVQKPQFYFDNWDYYVDATGFILVGEKLKYLLGLLNSKFTAWAFRKFYMWTELGSKWYRYKKAFIEDLPIPYPTLETEQKIVSLVDEILEKKEKWEDTTELERQIDGIVYDLYGLDEEERRVVEKSLKK